MPACAWALPVPFLVIRAVGGSGECDGGADQEGVVHSGGERGVADLGDHAGRLRRVPAATGATPTETALLTWA